MSGLSTMRMHGLRCVHAAVLLAYGAHAQERAVPPSVVLRECSGCHAVNGDSQLPYVPRLAGLSASYLESKLDLYRGAPKQQRNGILDMSLRRRHDADAKVTTEAANLMVGIAKTTSKDDLKVAVRWYASQAPLPSGNSAQTHSEGGELFTKGIPGKDIRPCQSCHGVDGEGSERAPRLTGQHAAYVLSQLSLFRENGLPSWPMTGIARSLPQEEAQAIARYLENR